MERTIRVGDREITRMGLGSNRLTHTPENVAFIRAAVEAGVGMIDTAHLYTGGQSEETIGEALGGAPGATLVATKGGFGAGEGRAEVLRDQIETSFRQLRTDSIELYYLHRVHAETPLEESVGVVKEYVDRGQIRHLAISEVSVGQIEAARKIVPIAAVQNECNVSERKWDDVVDYCTRESIAFVPFRPLKGDVTPALEAVAQQHSATTRQIALAWLLHRSPMILPVPGSLSITHVKENLTALDVQLTEEDFRSLD